MKILIFGATGMLGQGLIHACLSYPAVEHVLLVLRQPTVITDPRIEQLVHQDFFHWADVEHRFAGFDACLFAVGATAVGKSEAEYHHLTFDLTQAAALAVFRHSPQAVFEYISGQGTDSTEKGRSMWARVKGATENMLRAIPFRAVYCFRPGYIQPMQGIRSRVGWYNLVYTGLGWGYPLWRRLAPGLITSSEELGCAMLFVAANGWHTPVLETRDINAAASART